MELAPWWALGVAVALVVVALAVVAVVYSGGNTGVVIFLAMMGALAAVVGVVTAQELKLVPNLRLHDGQRGWFVFGVLVFLAASVLVTIIVLAARKELFAQRTDAERPRGR